MTENLNKPFDFGIQGAAFQDEQHLPREVLMEVKNAKKLLIEAYGQNLDRSGIAKYLSGSGLKLKTFIPDGESGHTATQSVVSKRDGFPLVIINHEEIPAD